jgi:hypothetical protein
VGSHGYLTLVASAAHSQLSLKLSERIIHTLNLHRSISKPLVLAYDKRIEKIFGSVPSKVIVFVWLLFQYGLQAARKNPDLSHINALG